MKTFKFKNKKFKKTIPWILLIIATIFSNLGLLLYTSFSNSEDIPLNDVFFLNVTLDKPNVPKSSNNSIIAVVTAEKTKGEKKEVEFFYNKDYYDLLQRDENYKSLFEDLYLEHLRIVLNKKIGIDKVDAIETAALLDLGYTDATPRVQRISAQVKGLEYFYFNDLFLRGAIEKVNGDYQYTKVFEQLIDYYFDMFRPVKTHHIFVPFKKPLYYTPYNYPNNNGENVDPIYTDTNSFNLTDLFETNEIQKLGGLISNLLDLDNYVSTFNNNNPNNQILDIRDLMMELYDNYSSIIDSILKKQQLDIGLVEVENNYKGESYITLSSNTFDQRLRSYSGSLVPSYTEQALLNSYLALDSLNFNPSMQLNNQLCDTEDPNKGRSQILNLPLTSSSTNEDKANILINSLSIDTTIQGNQVRRLSNCFSILPINSNVFGNNIVIVSISNYGMHFVLPLDFRNGFQNNEINMKTLFKKNLMLDLLTCNNTDGTEQKCDNARSSLVEAFINLKYFPLLLTDLFNNISFLDSNVKYYIERYLKNLKTSFKDYGKSIFEQASYFATYETFAATYVPIEYDLDIFFNNSKRWE